VTINNFCSLPQIEVEEVEMQAGWFEEYRERFQGTQREPRADADAEERRDQDKH
jgi:hypothetical protein